MKSSAVPPESLERYKSHIRRYVKLFVVPNLIGELDKTVATEMSSAIRQKMTSEECVETLMKLGLKPVPSLKYLTGDN